VCLYVDIVAEYEKSVKETHSDMASMGSKASSTGNINLIRSLQGYKAVIDE